jgi:hypothetical protein
VTFTPPPGTLPTREVSKIVKDILQMEMGLDNDHCLLGNQKWNIPPDKKLFVVVFDTIVGRTGAANFLDTDATSPYVGQEVQQLNALHDCRVEIMSFDDEARLRKEEVVMALQSIFAQQMMGKYKIGIGRPQDPVDASETEASSRLFKFVSHVNVTCLHQKVKTPTFPYYDDKFNGATVDGTILPPALTTQE